VAILLPYNTFVALPVALAASGVVAGRRVAIRFSSELPKTSQLLASLLEETVPSLHVAQDSGRQFILRHLRRAETLVLVVFGDDQWAVTYEDLVRRCDRKKFIFDGPAKDPFIVLESANLEQACEDAVRGALFNGGQAPLSPKRFYVVKSVAGEFTRRLLQRMQAWKSEREDEGGSALLPIINQNVVQRVQAQIEEALAYGAKLRCGGQITARPQGPGYLVEPTVLTGVDHSMVIMRDETLAPVLPVRVVCDADEAAAMAEDSRYGQAASVYGDAPHLVRRLRLSHGLVCENSLAIDRYKFEAGIGRFKSSGWVWERSEDGFCRREGRRKPHYVEFQEMSECLPTAAGCSDA
jgi:acyl-CoA reductase-like NAD-dependent aldehyde dehydrogenase